MEDNEQLVGAQQLGLGWTTHQFYALGQVTLPSWTSFYSITNEDLT